MMVMLLTSCKFAWGIEYQKTLHDAGEGWIRNLGENNPFLKKHLAELKLVCADIANLPQHACELIYQADAIFIWSVRNQVQNVNAYRRILRFDGDAWQKRDPYSFEYAAVPIVGKEHEAKSA